MDYHLSVQRLKLLNKQLNKKKKLKMKKKVKKKKKMKIHTKKNLNKTIVLKVFLTFGITSSLKCNELGIPSAVLEVVPGPHGDPKP